MQVRKLKKLTHEDLKQERWWPIADVAKRLGVSITTIRNRVDRGEMQARNFHNRAFVEFAQ